MEFGGKGGNIYNKTAIAFCGEICHNKTKLPKWKGNSHEATTIRQENHSENTYSCAAGGLGMFDLLPGAYPDCTDPADQRDAPADGVYRPDDKGGNL